MSQESLEAVRQSFARWNDLIAAKDAHGIREFFAEAYHADATFDWSATTPDGTLDVGIDAMVSYLGVSGDALEEVRFEPLDVIEVAEDIQVIPAVVTGRGTASGVTVQQEIVYVNRIREGKIASTRTYPTLFEALKVAGAEQ